MPGRGPATAGRRRDLSDGAPRHREGAVPMSKVVEVFPDSEALVEAGSRRLVDALQAAVAARGRALIVLTGSGNGIALLRYLREPPQQIDWSQVHLFWGDERYV